MKKRNIIIILLMIIAVAVLVITQVLNNGKEKEHHYLLNGLKFANIKSVYIKNYVQPKGFTLLKNKNNKWIVKGTGKECNKYRLEYIINLLKTVDFNNIISTKKENYKNFNVDDKNSIIVKIHLENNILPLWIGKFTPDGNGCYIRLKDGNVYLITKNLTFEFDKGEKYFYLEKKSK